MQASLRQGSRGAYDLAARSRSRCPLSLPLFPQPCSRPQLTSNTVRFASVRSRASASGTPGPQQPERPAGESQSSPQPGPEPQPVASTSAELVQQGVPSEAGSSQEPPLDVVEPSAVYEADNLQADLVGEWLRIPDAITQQATALYTAMAAAYAVQGLALTLSAWLSPTLLLNSAVSQGPAVLATANMLQGAVGATCVMVSGILLHLRLTASAGELRTLRHQRINALLALYGVYVFIGTLRAGLAGSPLLSGLLLATSGALAAACVQVTRVCVAHRPWLCWSWAGNDLATTGQLLSTLLRRDVSTVAGVVCLVFLAVMVCSAPDLLFSSLTWATNTHTATAHATFGMHPLYPYATPAAALPTLDTLRRVAGAGVVVAGGVAAHTLLESCVYARGLGLMEYVRAALPSVLGRDTQPTNLLLQPPPERFRAVLGLSVITAGGLLIACLARAYGLGLDLNQDAWLMGPLFWQCIFSVVYTASIAFTLDWGWVLDMTSRVFVFFMQLVSSVTQTLVLKLEWTRPHKL